MLKSEQTLLDHLFVSAGYIVIGNKLLFVLFKRHTVVVVVGRIVSEKIILRLCKHTKHLNYLNISAIDTIDITVLLPFPSISIVKLVFICILISIITVLFVEKLFQSFR